VPQAAAEPQPQPERDDDGCPTCNALLACGDPRVVSSAGFRPLLRLKGPVRAEADWEHIRLHAQRCEPVVIAMGSSFPPPQGEEGWADAVAAACGDSALTFQRFVAAADTPEARQRPKTKPVSVSFATVLEGRKTRFLGGKCSLKLSDLSATSAELAQKPTQQTAIAHLMESAVRSLAVILPGADYLLVRLPSLGVKTARAKCVPAVTDVLAPCARAKCTPPPR
jgi:hypothetical protein